ncbi:MAG: methyltransferase [Pseudomonadota bacterium]
MAAIDPGPAPNLLDRLRIRRDRLFASPRFQAWAARFPLTKARARRDGQALFDLVAGFAYSQALHATVSLELPDRLANGPKSSQTLALETGFDPAAMQRLCQAASALGLLSRGRDGRFRLARLGAALRGVPGLQDMILHHDILYRDLARPEAFLRGETEPELAGFWPYVFGAGAAADPEQAARYSQLMTETQTLVAEETLKSVDLGRVSVLMDVGGGTGAFLRAALDRHEKLQGVLVDLPAVKAPPHPRMIHRPCDFQSEPLPEGADAISLIRVLYDHRDEVVAALLAKAHTALPAGGRIIISEPMSGGVSPTRSGDVYFAFYCMAMGTGTVRDAARISDLLREAGFSGVEIARMDRAFVTQVVTAVKA